MSKADAMTEEKRIRQNECYVLVTRFLDQAAQMLLTPEQKEIIANLFLARSKELDESND
jgi:hypothetical protein